MSFNSLYHLTIDIFYWIPQVSNTVGDNQIAITVSGKVARFVASHRPTVPVLAFCLDPQVARRLQLNRGIYPVLLQSSLNPYDQKTRMGILRAEAMRTAVELGLARAGDRVITVDRTVGKPNDMHTHSYNMKMSTLKAQ